MHENVLKAAFIQQKRVCRVFLYVDLKPRQI
jgi:hypothetical protein